MQYSIRTEQAYVDWCHRFLAFCGDTPTAALGVEDVQRFLTHLAVDRSVAAKTQSLAYNAVAFLFKQVLERPLEDVRFARTKRQQRLPVVLTREEVRRLCEAMDGTFGLMARLMYGTGMRLMECVRLRVADLDFGNRSIVVRNGKGGKDRMVPLPERLREPLEAHLARVKALHERDLAAGAGAVYLPEALGRKYPNAAREWIWQYVFPSSRLSQDPKSGRCAAIICTSRRCRGRSRRPGSAPACRSGSTAMRCGIRSRRICWRPGTTSARCRSCWDMRMCRRR